MVGQEDLKMKRKRHNPEQIIRKLRDADRWLSEGKDIALVCQSLEVSEATFHRWRNQYGGMKANEAKHLKELQIENRRLKKAVDAAFHQDNKVDLRDPDTGAAIIGFTKFTRDRSTDVLESWITNVQTNFCMKCHDADGALASYNVDDGGTAIRPFSSTSRDVPIVFESLDPTNPMHHAVRAAGNNPYCIPSASNGSNVTMEPPWNQDATHDQITCFDCHGTIVTDADGTLNLVSAHGGVNQRMLRTAIDFDGIEAAGAAADFTLIPANARFDTETFCTLCHKATVYVSAGNSEAVGSIYEFHGASQPEHSATGGNRLGCMGCHGGIVDFSGLVDNGARRGNLHGDLFTWPIDSFATGTTTEYFMFGGWIGGWETDATRGYCRGGDCAHTTNTMNYTR